MSFDEAMIERIIRVARPCGHRHRRWIDFSRPIILAARGPCLWANNPRTNGI